MAPRPAPTARHPLRLMSLLHPDAMLSMRLSRDSQGLSFESDSESDGGERGITAVGHIRTLLRTGATPA